MISSLLAFVFCSCRAVPLWKLSTGEYGLGPHFPCKSCMMCCVLQAAVCCIIYCRFEYSPYLFKVWGIPLVALTAQILSVSPVANRSRAPCVPCLLRAPNGLSFSAQEWSQSFLLKLGLSLLTTLFLGTTLETGAPSASHF